MDKTELDKLFEELPEDIKKLLLSTETSSQLQAIASKNKLRIDKVDQFIFEFTKVAVGMTKSNDFVRRLSETLEISMENAEHLALDVDEQIFKRIRASLRTVQNTKTPERFTEMADVDYGSSPIRDSMIKDIERSSNDVSQYASGTDYNAGGFTQNEENHSGSASYVPSRSLQEEASQPMTQPEDGTPNPVETFKDKLQNKIDRTKHQVNVDPYKEPIE